ncbi:Os07g0610600 [Oryza sativa Japonica Group]|uniref:Os07g0610600 protein n=1 Tax=Oryza sativa subsp. japonica TaxID=39947 RepID=A0A0P0X915_ORYSJ|nr:uncharacterized protein LOC107277861 [Oryza sativa Japonica Group]BAT02606.1 Os07g0610600 [Oryza sativa Japonica Group]
MASARYTTWLHPEHSLTRRVYGGKRGAAGVCNVCDRTISGGSYGYRCGGGAACGGFDVHEACLTLPKRVKLGRRHRDHELTLSVLTASRRCVACRETSDAGRCMYRCVECDVDVHPRCTPLLMEAGGASGRRWPQHGWKRRAAKRVAKVALNCVLEVVITVVTSGND